MDDLGLDRALDLLEYAARETEEISRAKRGELAEAEPVTSVWKPIDEKQAEENFAQAHHIFSTPGQPAAPITRVPEVLRDMIRWAESEKKKRGLN